MTPADMLNKAMQAVMLLEQIQAEAAPHIVNCVRGDPWFELWSSAGGVVGNARHLCGMLREVVDDE